MLRRSSKGYDFVTAAPSTLEKGIGEHLNRTPLAKEDEGKNPHAVALGRIGGRKGGRARAEKLTRERRREIALKAARARWGKRKGLRDAKNK